MQDSQNWSAVIDTLIKGHDLSLVDAAWVMERVIATDFTDAQLAGFLVALSAKGETVNEIMGFRNAALKHALPLHVDPMVLDIVGTGGDRLGTVNISTMASIVAAASGVPVVKFGNRGASSSSGSSDVLSALGVDLNLSPERVAATLQNVGITFVFAAVFHPGFKHAAAVRRELGIPTIFNVLGPLCNPARPEASAVGVARLDRVPLIAGVFQSRGATALVFRGDDGLDELTTTSNNHIWEISQGQVTEHELDSRDLNIPRATIADLQGGDAQKNARIIHAVFSGEHGPVRDIVLLNAAAGLVSFDLAKDPLQAQRSILDRFRQKIVIAAETIDSGAAAVTLNRWVAVTQH